VSGPQRVAALPTVPTFAEVKLDELNWMAFFGIVAPAKTPPPIIARLNTALQRALSQSNVRTQLAAQQAVVVANSPEQFGAEINRELDRMRRATAAAKISID
jgi:tripartite-type tricarboxylate transporter receptor subunit TctC